MNSKNIDVKSLLDPDENASVVTAPTDILEVHEDQRATVLIKDIITFKDAVNNLLKPDIQEDLTENAISFNDITERLNPNNLNLETGAYITPVLSQEGEFSPSAGFHGFATVKTKPLEEVIVPNLAPSNFVRGEGILVQANLVDYSGIGQLTVKNIALNDKAAYVITQEDVETFSNTETNFIELDLTNMKVLTEKDGKQAVSTDAPADTFGASKLYLNVPLVPNKNITVNANNLGATLTPAGIPVNLDGTESSNKDGYGALGYKSITLDAALVPLDAASVLKKAKEGGGSLLPGDVNIGFNVVSIPNLKPKTFEIESITTGSITGETVNVSFTPEDVTIYTGYALKAVTTREIDFGSYIVHAIGSQHFATSTNLEFLPNGTGNGDIYLGDTTACEAISKFTLQIPGQYNPVISASTMSSILAQGYSSIIINSSGVDVIGDTYSTTINSNSYGDTGKILNTVYIALPAPKPPESSPIQVLMLDHNITASMDTEFSVSNGGHIYQTSLEKTQYFNIYVSGSGSYYSDSLTICQYDSETDRLLHTAVFKISGSLSSAPMAIDFEVDTTSVYAKLYVDSDWLYEWKITDEYNENNKKEYSKSSSTLDTALATYKLDSNNKFYIVVSKY